MILLTGANGFVGSAVLSRCIESGLVVRPMIRSLESVIPLIKGIPYVVHELDELSLCNNLLEGITQIIHCAARVHILCDEATDSLEAYREINVRATLNLATQAAAAGVKRFVFLSTIKVNGEFTVLNYPFHADDSPSPKDPYSFSKMEAEHLLLKLMFETDMEIVIVRPPLVYGPAVKANFASMIRWVASGIPLPLGAIHNLRSMVAVDNLADFLITCLKHPAAAGQTFLISDGEDISTPELLRRTAQAMGKNSFLLPVPVSLLRIGADLLGMHEVAQRLCGSLQVDIEKSRSLLGWTPRLTLDQGLKKAVEGLTQ